MRDGPLNALELAIKFGHSDCVRTILLHEKWKEFMENARMKRNVLDTPMRMLLRKMPDLAIIVLNRSVHWDNEKNGDSIAKIKIDYSYIDDLGQVVEWANIKEETRRQNNENKVVIRSDSIETGFVGPTSPSDAVKYEQYYWPIAYKRDVEKISKSRKKSLIPWDVEKSYNPETESLRKTTAGQSDQSFETNIQNINLLRMGHCLAIWVILQIFYITTQNNLNMVLA